MSDNDARAAGTFMIWTALTIITVAAMVTNIDVNGAYLFAGIIALIIAGAVTTGAIWRSGRRDSDDSHHAEKAKRNGKVERLLARLDERDLEELRSRLLSENDGETVSLEELLTDREKKLRG